LDYFRLFAAACALIVWEEKDNIRVATDTLEKIGKTGKSGENIKD